MHDTSYSIYPNTSSFRHFYRWLFGGNILQTSFLLHVVPTHANLTVSFCVISVSSKMLLQRPIAGSQVPFCPIEKKMLDSWSQIEPCTFKVRAVNYFR